MDILKLKTGEIQVKDFDPKSENLIKVRLHVDGDQGEGIWACLPDDFMSDYKSDASDSTVFRYATLRNASLNIGPESWGLIIPVKFNGDERPECNLSWIDEEYEMIFNKKETIEV